MLKDYIEKYYNLLLKYIQELQQKGILYDEFQKLLTIENKEFILNPDNSSIINFLHKEVILWVPQYLWDYKIYEKKLKKEIELFLSWKQDELIMNKWQKINWTNIKLTLEDNNPYNLFDAHPDHKDNWWTLWFWEKSEIEWLEVFEKTFKLLQKVDMWIYDELNQIIKKIIPLWTAKNVHNSASYKECIWHLYLWYTINAWNPEINNLEAIIHESSHNKLNLIKQFDSLLLNDYSEKYYSAIRPDARHIHWVFIWYHAFAPTMYIVMKAYKDWFLWNDRNWFEKIVLYYIKTKFLQKVVKKHAKFTPLWLEISKEIDYVITLMDQIFKELKPTESDILQAKEKQKKHFEEVNSKYINLEY